MESFGVPAVHVEVGESDPDWHGFGGVSLRIEVQGPPIEVETLWPHEIGFVPEY